MILRRHQKFTCEHPMIEYPLRQRLLCKNCGRALRRKVIRGVIYWCCPQHDKSPDICNIKQLEERQIYAIFCRLYYRPEYFPEQAGMTRKDYMIICGDFGGVWDGSKKEQRTLDWLESLPFTTLFVSGNHENFDRLKKYPVEEWNGGRVQAIRPHVLHLTRGQIFELQGYTFFTMGGTSSHDIDYGILDPKAPDFEEQYWTLRRMGVNFRVNHRSWWKEELPSEAEYKEARCNLERVNHQVDYVISHCAPSSIEDIIGGGGYVHDHLTDFLEEVKQNTKFHYWLYGHYHDNKIINDRFVLLWEQIVQII